MRRSAGIDAELVTGGTITGVVTGSGGVPLVGACVTPFDGNVKAGEAAVTDAGGQYAIQDLRSTAYKLLFESCGAGNLAYEWYTDRPTIATAGTVSTTAGATTAGVNAELGPGGTISGLVTDGLDPVVGACVTALDPANEAVVYSSAETEADGTYALDGLRAARSSSSSRGIAPPTISATSTTTTHRATRRASSSPSPHRRRRPRSTRCCRGC